MESEKRDLEIRLAKALADAEVMGKQLGEIRGAKDDLVKQLAQAKARVGQVEERERDREVAATRVDEERREKVGSLQEEVDELRREVQLEQEDRERVQEERDRVQEELNTARAEMAEMADEEQRKGSREESLQDEVESMREQLESLEAELEQERRGRDEVERELEQERRGRDEVEREIEQERSERVKLETANREVSTPDFASTVADDCQLRKALRAAKADQASSSATTEEVTSLRNELARLRSESASKDLEIVNLERRKAELKEDREMLNIALDSKQQELELVSGVSPWYREHSRCYLRVGVPS